MGGAADQSMVLLLPAPRVKLRHAASWGDTLSHTSPGMQRTSYPSRVGFHGECCRYDYMHALRSVIMKNGCGQNTH